MKNIFPVSIIIFFILLLTALDAFKANAYSVTQIKSVYQNGQVFLTWKCPNAKNLRYNVYRSSSPILTTNDLNQSLYIGDVRDSSSKDFRLSMVKGKNVFVKLQENTAPLRSNDGLYVVTCTAQGSFYYAVTIIKLSNNIEDKSITPGANSLSLAVQETVADPQPVYQDSVIWKTGDVAKYYVQFVTNQDAAHYPAMCNQGSYIYNFYLVRRGNYLYQPLFVFYEGLLENSIKGNGLGQFENGSITNCTIMGCDDWLPTPNSGSGPQSGDKTFWVGYHENFDMYTDSNPTPNTGVIRTYTQARLMHGILWANKYLPIDSNKVYLVGVSAGGFGVLVTANIYPDKIAGVYAIVPPVHGGTSTDEDTQLFGSAAANLPSDILDPNNGDSIRIWDLMELRHMTDLNANRGLPWLVTVSGKNDQTITWSTKPSFFDSLQVSHQGGTFYWDQRDHDGSGANFFDNETTPNFYVYSKAKSFPAFSNCSINQNPGNGDSTNGDPYGAINGYLDFDSSVIDQSCTWSDRMFIKKMYVGGVLQPKYNNCTSDITLRRPQQFHPGIGSTIKWSNFNSMSKKIQHGSFVYNGGPITLTGIKLQKAGNKIEFDVSNCLQEFKAVNNYTPDYSSRQIASEKISNEVFITNTLSGAEVHFNLSQSDNIQITILDMMGRIAGRKLLTMPQGLSTTDLPSTAHGIYLVEVKGNSIWVTQKVIF